MSDDTPYELTDNDMVAVSGHLAELMGSQLPLASGLAALAREDNPPRLRRQLMSLSRRLSSGDDVASVLAKMHPDPELVALLQAGARSGHTDQVLLGYLDHINQVKQIRRRVRLAMMYPLCLLLVALCGGAFFLILQPDAASLVEDFGTELNWWTASAFAAARFVRSHARVLVTAVPLALLAMWWLPQLLLSAETRRAGWLRVPILGRIFRLSALSRFLKILAVLVRHRVPLADGIQLAGECSGDPVLKRNAGQLASRLETGASVEHHPEALPYFPLNFSRLLTSVKDQAALVSTIDALSQSHQSRLLARVNSLTTLIRPTIVIAIGVLVAAIFLIQMLPLMNLLRLLS